MGRLSTHVLDTANGKPAAGVTLHLFRLDPDRRHLLTSVTNADGRCSGPLLEGEALTAGIYELVFEVANYFARQGTAQAEPPFVGEAVLRFGIANPDQHYHVPLLVSPWSYTTYRGS
jgi:5-hydroxyisourate hydrolase